MFERLTASNPSGESQSLLDRLRFERRAGHSGRRRELKVAG
jgi:hypothetical protein